jgi:hypothetical protein
MKDVAVTDQQVEAAEQRYASELAFLEAFDSGRVRRAGGSPPRPW